MGPAEETTRTAALRGPQAQATRVEGLLDLLDRLAAKVRDRVELGLRLLHQVADRLHAGALEAVVGAHSQLELLDQDVVHPVGRAAAGSGPASTQPGQLAVAHQAGALLAQRLDPLG